MDSVNDDVRRRFNRYEACLKLLGTDGDMDATKIGWKTSTSDAMRAAVISAAIQRGDAHLPRIAETFTAFDIDVIGLVHRLRVRAVIERLS